MSAMYLLVSIQHFCEPSYVPSKHSAVTFPFIFQVLFVFLHGNLQELVQDLEGEALEESYIYISIMKFSS